ncbi:MAG: RNA polymerase sigma factor [Bacteroidota bacterium]
MQPAEKDTQILQLLGDPARREQGFRLLVNTYGDRLYQHIRRMVHTHEDTDDVLQNTMVKVYRSVDRFRGQSQLYTWLYRIATNESLTFLERQKRQRTLFTDNPEGSLPMARAAEVELDGEHIRQRLDQAIATLPPKQKAVFSMRYFEEKSYQEMADIFTTSVGALKASYHHAVKKIESYLSQG